MSNNWSEEELAEKLQNNPDLQRANSKPPETAHKPPAVEKPKLKGKVNKYHVAPKEDRTYNGVVYASKKEATFAYELDLKKGAKIIDFWIRQVPFPLPGGSTYRLDFMTFRLMEKTQRWFFDPYVVWEIEFYEVKGKELPMGKLKRKQCEEIYKIQIKVV